ncbi:excinuclease ABC subunit UvrA [SAR202 cluster bacterium AC-409-J13_OGT_754m]|nr:excinuclease ABC subunit UvrA [SAR202 cluster bacterium AC-409-J13_OGT_754m]
MTKKTIIIRGAKQHNLKNIDLIIPRDQLVVITGVSGSGKSSLAFDTIYAEGQRRYIESLSAYARQFLGRMEKPDVEYIEGLSPSISIDQKGVSHNPRSTVGTVTEIYDYLRLLYARVGRPHCPKCNQLVTRQTIQEIVDSILNNSKDTQITILAPKVIRRKGEHREIFEDARKNGFSRVRVDGQLMRIEDTNSLTLDRQKWHYIELAVDRLVIDAEIDINRVTDSVEIALKEGNGLIQILTSDNLKIEYSEQFACVKCGTSLSEIEPRTFSFNSPHGACDACTGLGFKLEVDPDLIFANKDITLSEGGILPWSRAGTASPWYASLIESLANIHNFSTNVPIKDLPVAIISLILYGNQGESIRMRHKTYHGRIYSWETNFEGVIPNLSRRFKTTESDWVRAEIERYMSANTCLSCSGFRLRPEALSVTVDSRSIMEICSLPITQVLSWVKQLENNTSKNQEASSFSSKEQAISNPILKEILGRLEFLENIGLGYLTLGRSARTLSGGEAQRIRLATQIGSGLTGVLYVCDEPTVGLHPADDDRLIGTLKALRDLGNCVLVVEHDEAMMHAADHIIDLGPGAGEHGGNVVISGNLKAIMACKESSTGLYLSGKKVIPTPILRRQGNEKFLAVFGAEENNLKNIDVKFPLGQLVCVTGVSGSGKSSLVYEILYKRLSQAINKGKAKPGRHKTILGIENLDKVINIDQSPIGRTPRSNPATYTGTFTPIRELFGTLPESRARGYKPGRFSFNVKGGRCETCQGGGFIQVSMQFLPDVTVQCESCDSQRYNREALEILYRGHTISDILNLTVESAIELFKNIPKIRTKLETMRDVGLGYIKLGQPATTLSGGEAQRVKLSTQLSRRATGKTLYMLDEPTTGLSFEDCHALVKVLHRLVDSGNSVILIEHHLDMIKNADWVIDIGPGAADEGGWIVGNGTPEDLMRNKNSVTGFHLNLKSNKHTGKKQTATD